MRDYLTLGIIAAIVAGNTAASADMLIALAREDAKWAAEVVAAMNRGLDARKSTEQEQER